MSNEFPRLENCACEMCNTAGKLQAQLGRMPTVHEVESAVAGRWPPGTSPTQAAVAIDLETAEDNLLAQLAEVSVAVPPGTLSEDLARMQELIRSSVGLTLANDRTVTGRIASAAPSNRIMFSPSFNPSEFQRAIEQAGARPASAEFGSVAAGVYQINRPTFSHYELAAEVPRRAAWPFPADADVVEVPPAPPTPVEAAQVVAPTLEEQRLEMFAEYGVTAIPDSECTDMGDYVIWNNYDPSCSLFLSHPENIDGSLDSLAYLRQYGSDRYLRERMAKKYRAHPTKRVRLQGWYLIKVEGGYSFVRYFFVTRTNAQGSYTFAGSYYPTSDSYSSYIAHIESATAERTTIQAVDKSSRNWWVEARLSSVIDRSQLHRRVSANIRLSQVGNKARSYTQDRFGRNNNWTDWDLRRKALAEMSRVVSEAEDLYASDFIEAYKEARALGMHDLCDRMLERWNDKCSPRNEVMLAGCGHIVRAGDTHSVHGGEDVCEKCFEEYYVYVENTDDYRHRNNVYFHESEDAYFTYSEEDQSSLKEYSTDVRDYLKSDSSIVSTQYGDFLMGVELEVVPYGGSRSSAIKHTQDKLCKDYAILKRDGSLSDGGFEIVTAPRGLKEHIKRFGDWDPYSNLRAWDPGCCGLHVHMSSEAFSQATLGKFIEFICAEENDPMIQRIAGRSPTNSSQARSYCRRDHVFPGNIKATLRQKAESGERYRMVNVENLDSDESIRLGAGSGEGEINTVELRIFRASLKKSRLLAQIEFAHAAVMFCRWTSMRELRFVHFEKWLKKSAGMYPHLAKWFGVRANSDLVIKSPAAVTEAEV